MKIGVIGLGLIGGSILRALSARCYDLVGVTRNEQTIKSAKEYAVNVGSSIEMLKDCAVVFVATPMSQTLRILDELENIVSKDAVVTDVCSLKEFVMQKERPYNFVGSHPMAGTENSGWESSFAGLFKGAKWVLTPPSDMEEEVFAVLKHLISAMGATPIIADAKEHDDAVAKISHMPMLLAQAIYDAASGDKLAMKLASSGFRDMTRLAMSNVDMAEDMINMNAENIENALLEVNLSVKDLKRNYKTLISKIKTERAKMYDENGKNVL